MATGTLSGIKPSVTYKSLLKVASGGTAANTELSTSLQVIEDGHGNNSALKLAKTGQTIGASINGRLGVGTDSPGHSLVVGDAPFNFTADEAIQIASAGDTHLIMGEDANNYGRLSWDASANSLEFHLVDGGSTRANALVIDQTGYVGIGTAGPITNLHILSSGTGVIRLAASADGNDSRMDFYQATTAKGTVGYDDGNDTVALIYDTSLDSTKGINISSSGNVGIGDTTPTTLLYLAATEPYITFDGTAGDGDSKYKIGTGDGNLYFTDVSAGTPSMTIDDNLVGIGTDPDSALHIKDSDITSGGADASLHVECTEGTADSSDVLVWLDWSADAAVHELARWISIHDSGGEIGYLTSSDGAGGDINVDFTQPSDIRWKKDIVDTSLEGLNIINNVKVRDFKWNSERENREDKQVIGGFVADELYEVYPHATSGTPGAMKTKVTPAVEAVNGSEGVEAKDAVLDEEGNIIEEAVAAVAAVEAVEAQEEITEEVIDAMGVTQGNLISVLVKAVQELSAKVEALESA